MKSSQLFFVGTYQDSGAYVPKAMGEGILTCSLDLETGLIKTLQVFREHLNATYLTGDDRGQLYVANDRFDQPGEVWVFSIRPDGTLKKLGTQGTQGTSTCHVEFDPVGKRIFISSYANGRLSVHHFDGKGFSRSAKVHQYQGNGPNKERQEAAHIHQAVISPDGHWLYACDLGSDKIWIHRMSEPLQLKGEISTSPGSGPRHMVCHPDHYLVYILGELDGKLYVQSRSEASGELTPIIDLPTLPSQFEGVPAAAAIRLHPSARSLFVSNRNHNSITAFKLNEKGIPRFHSTFSIKGQEPRDFNIDPSGKWLLSANQNSDSIIPFELDPDSGLPTGSHGPEFRCGTPVCILFQEQSAKEHV